MCCCWVDSFNSAYSKAKQIFWEEKIYRTDFSIGWKAEHCCWHLVRREDHIKDILPIFLPRGCFGQLTFGIWGAWRNHLWLLKFKKEKRKSNYSLFLSQSWNQDQEDYKFTDSLSKAKFDQDLWSPEMWLMQAVLQYYRNHAGNISALEPERIRVPVFWTGAG